jgi:DNA-binding response OmpR family regulator
VLLVEDTALVATMIETLIEDMGWTVVGPMARLNAALAAARVEPADAAIVDVNLAGEAAWEVASILRERGIPFILTTGYGDQAQRPPDLATAPILGKPFQVTDLEDWLRNAVPHAPSS